MRKQEEDDEVVADRTILRVPMMFMDSSARNAAVDAVIKDTLGMPAAPVRTLPMTDEDRTRRSGQVDAYNERITSAWKNPPPLAATQAATDASKGASVYDRYDARLRDAWRGKEAA